MEQRLSENQIKHRVRRMLARRFLFRFHVTLILLWTVAVGLLTTKGLLLLGVTSMAVRYPLAVLMAYLGFLMAVRVWLWYVGIDRRRDGDASFDIPADAGGSNSTGECAPTEMALRPGGGSFGGGGSSGDYVVDPAFTAELTPAVHSLEMAGETGETGGTIAESVVEAAGAADEAAIPFLLIAVVLGALVLVLGASAWLIIDAPAVLVEAAFEAMLAAGLIRATRRVDAPDWSAAVMRRTWLAATLIFLLSMAFAFGVQHYRPEARTVMEVLAPK